MSFGKVQWRFGIRRSGRSGGDPDAHLWKFWQFHHVGAGSRCLDCCRSRAQAPVEPVQPAPPPGANCTAAGRHLEPSLFTLVERWLPPF
jgi:hypothetical protein